MGRVFLSSPAKELEDAKMVAVVKGLARHYEITTQWPAVKQWVVVRLTALKLPFAVHNIGCGVVKITTETCICPKCKGTGRIGVKE